MLDEVLIPLQLGRGIPADVLVVVGRHGGVEDVYREVQHPVLRVFVGLDNLVHGALCKRRVEVFGRSEVAGIEITLADGEQVYGHQQANPHGGNPLAAVTGEGLGMLCLAFGKVGPEKERGAGQDKEERTGCVGTENHNPVFFKRFCQNILHAGI